MKLASTSFSRITVTCVLVVLIFCASMSGPTVVEVENTDMKSYFKPKVNKFEGRSKNIESDILNILAAEEIREFLKKLPVGSLNEINSMITEDAHLGREYLQQLMKTKLQSEDNQEKQFFKSTFVDSVMRGIWRQKRKQNAHKWDIKKARSLGSFFLAPQTLRTNPTSTPSTMSSSTLPPILLENFEIFQIPSDIFLQNFKTSTPAMMPSPTTTEKPSLQKYLSFDQFLSSTQAKSTFWSTTELPRPADSNRYSSKLIQSVSSNKSSGNGNRGTGTNTNSMSAVTKVDKSFQSSHGFPTAIVQMPMQMPQVNPNTLNSNMQPMDKWSKPDTIENQNLVIQALPGTGNNGHGWGPSWPSVNNNMNTDTNQFVNYSHSQNQHHNQPQFTNQQVGNLNTQYAPNQMDSFNSQVPSSPQTGFINNQPNNYQASPHHSEQNQQHYSQFQNSPMPQHHQPSTMWTPPYTPSSTNDNPNNNDQQYKFNSGLPMMGQGQGMGPVMIPSYPAATIPSPTPAAFYATPSPHPQQYGWPSPNLQYNANDNFNQYNNNNPYHHQIPYDFHQYHQHQQQYPSYPPPPPPQYEEDKDTTDEEKDHKGFFKDIHKAVFGDKKGKHKGKGKGKDKEKEPNYGWPGWSGPGWPGTAWPGQGSAWTAPGSGWSGWSDDSNDKGKDKGSNENYDAVTSFSDTYDHYSKKASGWWDKTKEKIKDHFDKKAHDKHKDKKKKSFYSVTQKIYGISISILSFLAFGAYVIMLLFQSAVTYLTFPLLSGIIGLLSGDGGMQLVQFLVGRSLSHYPKIQWWEPHAPTNTSSSSSNSSSERLINELDSQVKEAFNSVKSILELFGN